MEKVDNYIKLCQKIDNIVFSKEFYPLSQINNISHKNVILKFKGVNSDSEKKMIAFIPKYLSDFELNFPVKYFKIEKKSKFISLEHKHYLGNILSLGIKREILGDLIVRDGVCYGIIVEEMFEFLKDNLSRINSSPVEVQEITENEIPESEFEIINILVSSMRLDSFVAEITNLSRNLAAEYVMLGNVQVNYGIKKEKDTKLNIGDVVIIKKYGKFIIFEDNGLSKKEKYKVIIKKFI